MQTKRKSSLPVARAREHLEPGPIILLTAAHRGQGEFRIAGRTVSRRGRFKKENLQ
jgi:hypothetical protein